MRDRSLTEWVVLALVAEGRTHGFDVARELAEGSALGRIWTVRRPLVYRAVDALVADGLVAEAGTAEGRGPQRRLLRVTPAGRRAVRTWLATPVEHVRDVRTELLLKLALLDRAGTPLADLAARQLEVLGPTVEGLQASASAAEGFDAVLARWRLESASAAHRFVRSLIETNEAPAPDPGPPRRRVRRR